MPASKLLHEVIASAVFGMAAIRCQSHALAAVVAETEIGFEEPPEFDEV
jgi:hypothetical protein